MAEAWLIELAKGIGRLFLNPLFYWSFLLVILAGTVRIKRERRHFGSRVYDIFAEWKGNWQLSLLLGLFISVLFIGIGFVFTYETILMLGIITILLSITRRFTLLSPSYTIGITYLLLLLLPFVMEQQTFFSKTFFSNTNFIALTILLGLLLLIEAQFISRTKNQNTFPELAKGKRGGWIGIHRMKRMAIIPFFVLIPSGLITPFADFWPFFTIGGNEFSLLLVPFLIGFEYKARTTLPQQSAAVISRHVLLLGLLVIALAIGSIFISWLSLLAVIIAIVGRELINYRYRIQEKEDQSYFSPTANGLRVLGVVPGTPADRLQILAGEVITKVNGNRIHHAADFYQALQTTGSFFKLEILDKDNEVRFVQSALYEGDHHELGMIFISEPYRMKSSD
ncbi:PDZ domain-containing protein [Ornithinibacillus gellani]|uniref:PDZ domain-containing protein n=1 Tax=Ornithinibacillus gellani TaxID=2293253 RepID=UPI000F470CEF|nr:PDZ domain-containing protein [Ornithinibacillus gellani]TQS74814.1 PDZ domain-containing protein [Ornithinibacillus gellani]